MRLPLAQIPNAICILRILLVVPIVASLVQGRYLLALALIFVAGFSDALDGFLAKRFDWGSWLGGILDPFADKLLLVSVFLALAWLGLAPLWLTAVVLIRDLVIVAGALAYHYFIGRVNANPTKISKLNTGLQLLYILLVVAGAATAWPLATPVLLAGAGVFLTSVVSGLDYVLTWSARARQPARA